MTAEIGRLIVLESTLSLPRPRRASADASWGMSLADGKDYLITGWWLATFPGLAIMLRRPVDERAGRRRAATLLEPRLRGQGRGAGA